MSENTNTEETQRLTRKLDPLVRPLLSERIKYRLSLCTRCGGTGVYVEDEIDFACMDCCDWLNALKDVEEYCPRTPTWDSMRDEVLYRAAMIEGRKSLTHWQIFSAKPWYAKAAIGVILVAIVCMVAMLVPHERPFSVEQPAATGKHIAVHYADNRNLFGHVFNP